MKTEQLEHSRKEKKKERNRPPSPVPRILFFDHEEGAVAPIHLLERVWITVHRF